MYSQRKVSVTEGLLAAGYEIKAGLRGRALIRFSDRPTDVKHYSFRRLKGGHYLTRRGHLTGATVTTFKEGPTLVEFSVS